MSNGRRFPNGWSAFAEALLVAFLAVNLPGAAALARQQAPPVDPAAPPPAAPAPATGPNTGNAGVTVNVPAESIPAFPIRSVAVEGTRALAAGLVAQTASAVAVGSVGSNQVLAAATRAIRDLYRSNGYPVERVIGVSLAQDGVLHLTVAEGTIRRIVIRGAHKTKKSTLLTALSLRAGDVYNEKQVKADRNRLARLGIFEDVVISAQVPGTEDEENPLDSTSAKGAQAGPTPDHSDGSTPTDAGAGSGSEASSHASGDQNPPPTKPTPGAPPDSTAPTQTNGAQPAPAGGPSSPRTTPATADGTVTTTPGATTPPATGAAATPAGAPKAPEKEPLRVLDALSPEDDDVGQVDLVVRVKERSTVNIAATVGYADSIGPVGFVDVSETNLAGTAQRVGIEWQRVTESYVNPDGSITNGESRQAVDVNYLKPALNDHAYSFSLDIYDKNTVFLPYFAGEDENIRTYEIRRGAAMSIGHSVGHNLTGYLLVKREDVGYDQPDAYYTGPLPPQSLLDAAAAGVFELGGELVADGRDTEDNPRHGYLHSFTFVDANNLLGGNRDFTQTTIDLRSYSPMNGSPKGPVLALRLLAGDSGGNVPLPEFYFLGGFELLRGYDLYSIFGDRMLVGTAEVRAQLSQGVQGVLFADEGNAWLPGTAISLGSLEGDVGVGLRFLSPIGPIRVDGAYGDGFKTYVTLGQSF